METTETEWGPWIEWGGGECPIPGAKAGDWQVRFRNGDEVSDSSPVGYLWWGREPGSETYEIVAYRLKATADDWKADMLAAWEAGELEVDLGDGWISWPYASSDSCPRFDSSRELYRRRPSAEKPQEPKPADPNAAMIARDGAPGPEAQVCGYMEATPSAPGLDAPTGLTTCAAFTHKLGGWGL